MFRDIADYFADSPNGSERLTTLVLNHEAQKPVMIAEEDRASTLPPWRIEPVMDDRYFCVRIRQGEREVILKFARSKSLGKVKTTIWSRRATRIWLEKEEDRARMNQR